MIKHYNVVHGKHGALIGTVSLKQPGWFFVSNVASHKGSRVGHATAEKAFPTWAKKMGCELVARVPDGESMRWNSLPLCDDRQDPAHRARAALHQIMPPTIGEVERRVAKAIQEAELSIRKEMGVALDACAKRVQVLEADLRNKL